MIFILRSERAPARVVRETDEEGTARTFWVWRDGAWVVATRHPDGSVEHACAETLKVELETGDNVSLVRVAHPPEPTETMPAPPPSLDERGDWISAVLPVAPRVADLDYVGVHAAEDSTAPDDPGSRATATRRARG
ncbi:MAG: hypothetical protein NVS3B10_12260 [Polyangiales bacterium]